MSDNVLVQLTQTDQPWRPFRQGILPPPVDDLKAQALYDAHERAAEHVDAVNQAEKDAQLAVRIADTAYTSEVERAAAAGEVSRLDVELLQARESANSAAHPDIFEARRQAGQAHATRATNADLDHVNEHALAYADALRGPAEKLATQVARINADTEKRLRPLREKHAELHNALIFALGGVEGLTAQDITDELGEPVALSQAALRRLRGVPEPQPEASEPVENFGPVRTMGGGVTAW